MSHINSLANRIIRNNNGFSRAIMEMLLSMLPRLADRYIHDSANKRPRDIESIEAINADLIKYFIGIKHPAVFRERAIAPMIAPTYAPINE